MPCPLCNDSGFVMEAETGATGQTTGKPYIFVPSLVQTDVPASLSSSPMVRVPLLPVGERSQLRSFLRYSSRSLTGMLPPRSGSDPDSSILSMELGEPVRNRLRSGLVIVLSQPPPDLGANLDL
jgi:hypothetical protein